MASTPVQFYAPSGLTLTLELFPHGSDTRANGSGDSCTEKTNAHGLYEATVTEAISGWHNAVIVDGSNNLIANYHVYLEDDTDRHLCGDWADVGAIGGDPDAATNAAAFWPNAVTSSAVNDASATTTSFITDLTEATDDHYNGASIVFISGNLLNQVRPISDYTGSSKTVTVSTAFTEAPADNDTFLILGRIG